VTRQQANALTIVLRDARLDAGISQKELEKKCGIKSVSISSWESGARIRAIKVSSLARILAALNISLSDFFARVDVLTEEFRTNASADEGMRRSA
jgi:transcriptional regulator with XRE-family HTH domain